jgi:hypothetical protein
MFQPYHGPCRLPSTQTDVFPVRSIFYSRHSEAKREGQGRRLMQRTTVAGDAPTVP